MSAISTQIIEDEVLHNGKTVAVYVPLIKVYDGDWTPVLSEGSYILKTTINPRIVCNKCEGVGCKECKDGLKLGTAVDQKPLAQRYLDIEVKAIERVLKYW